MAETPPLNSPAERLPQPASFPKPNPREERITKVLFLTALSILTVYCAIAALLLIAASASLIPNAAENTYSESPAIYTAILSARTGQLYYNFSQPPYASQPYGPLYYLLNAAIARFSDSRANVIAISGRSLAFGSFCLAALVLFLIARKLAFPAAVAALAALLYLGQADFYQWNVSMRPDMFCILLMLLALLAAVTAKSRPRSGPLVAGLLAGMAFLVKQSALAVAINVLAVWLLRRKHSQALRFAVAAAVPVGLIFGVLFLRREPFLEQFTSIGDGPWSFQDGLLWTRKWASDIRTLIPLAIAAVGIVPALAGSETSQLVAAFGVANLCFGVAGIAQLGGNFNYFLPLLTGCAMLLPFAVEVLRKLRRWPIALLALVLLLLWTASAAMQARTYPLPHPLAWREQSYAALRPFHILSDRPYFSLQGRDPEVLDPFFLHWLELNRHWDSSPVVAGLNSGGYDLVILACAATSHTVCNYRGVNYFSPGVVESINRNYEVLCSTPDVRILKPRSREIQFPAAALVPGCGIEQPGASPALQLAPGTR